MKLDGTWDTYKKEYNAKWHFNPLKKNTNDLKFICNVKTDYKPILNLCKKSIKNKNSNTFLSKHKSKSNKPSPKSVPYPLPPPPRCGIAP